MQQEDLPFILVSVFQGACYCVMFINTRCLAHKPASLDSLEFFEQGCERVGGKYESDVLPKFRWYGKVGTVGRMRKLKSKNHRRSIQTHYLPLRAKCTRAGDFDLGHPNIPATRALERTNQAQRIFEIALSFHNCFLLLRRLKSTFWVNQQSLGNPKKSGYLMCKILIFWH